jgi:hypothetical protein
MEMGTSRTLRKDVEEGVMEAMFSSPLGVGNSLCTCFSTKAILAEVGAVLVSRWIPASRACEEKISSFDLRSPWRSQLRSMMISGVKDAGVVVEPFGGVR